MYNDCRHKLRTKLGRKMNPTRAQDHHNACIANVAANFGERHPIALPPNLQLCEQLKRADCIGNGRCSWYGKKCAKKYCEDRDRSSCHIHDGCHWNRNGCGQLRGHDTFFDSKTAQDDKDVFYDAQTYHYDGSLDEHGNETREEADARRKRIREAKEAERARWTFVRKPDFTAQKGDSEEVKKQKACIKRKKRCPPHRDVFSVSFATRMVTTGFSKHKRRLA